MGDASCELRDARNPWVFIFGFGFDSLSEGLCLGVLVDAELVPTDEDCKSELVFCSYIHKLLAYFRYMQYLCRS